MSECSDAVAEVAKRSAEQGRAEANLDRANREAEDHTGPDLKEDGGAFIACLITGGLIAPMAGPAAGIVMVISGGTCLALSVAAMKIQADNRDRARRDVRDAERQLDEAKKALEDALKVARDKCQYADAGCGSRGGPGYRRPDGKCAGWDDWGNAGTSSSGDGGVYV